MKPLWFIGGIAAAATLIVGVGIAAAYSGGATSSKTLQPVTESVKSDGGCGCAHGAQAGGCGAAGCTAGCTQCGGQCGGGCSGGCSK
ncbi:MAG: hypothetical protein NTW66_01150 [Candidatus Magasanikbacteria bacterium]|nr:hypothetical protein [Candidatus Magasanikbacteria bacterium]